MADQADRLRQLVDRWQQSKAKRVIAIASGKGGVGKTNISVNLALALKQFGYSVTLLDADLGLANIDIVLGITPPYTLAHVLQRERSLSDIIYPIFGLKIVAGGNGLEELAALPDAEIQYLLCDVKDIESDFFLIDTGAGLSPLVLRVAMAAQEVVIITTPDPTSLTDAYALIKTLTKRTTGMAFHLIVNRVANIREAEQVSTNFRRVVKEFLSSTVNYLGYIPEDKLLKTAVIRQQPLLLAFPAAPASEQIRSIARTLGGIKQIPDKSMAGGVGFFHRLRSLFG